MDQTSPGSGPAPGSKGRGVALKRDSEPPGPGLSCESVQSDRSKDLDVNFKRRKLEQHGSATRRKSSSGPGSGPSCESVRSDRSKGLIINFKRRKLEQHGSATRRKSSSGPGSGPSCESLRSDRSKGLIINFKRDSEPPSPGLSCESVQSDRSKDLDVNFKRSSQPPGPGLSCESMQSDRSKEAIIHFKDAVFEDTGEELCAESLGGDAHLHNIFMRLEDHILTFVKEQLWRFYKLLAADYPECLELEEEGQSTEAVVSLTVDFLKRMKHEALAECLHSKSPRVYREDLKKRLQQKFTCVSEGIAKAGNPTVLKQIYTELHIIKGEAAGVNQEHEVMTIEAVSRRPAAPETTIKYEDLFKGHTQPPIREETTERQGPIREETTQRQGPIREETTERKRPIREETTQRQRPIREETTERQGPIREETTERKRPIREETTERQGPIREEGTERRGPIRTVLTKGVAGVGKTVLTQKFSLDWAEGRAIQDVQLLFPFTFRELNVLRDRQFSLVGLLQHFFGQTKGLCGLNHQVLFIFDGLDECRLPLDFSGTRVLTEPTECASLEVLLVNLIRGSLLPSARLWITTRPAAANQIPAECVSMVTEVRGFTDSQKEEYFRKRFRDEQQATAMISYMKKSRSLFIMCHLPVFCWMVAEVLHHVIESGLEEQLPQTMTEMYIHFLVVQAKVKSVKYDGRSETDFHWSPETKQMLEALAKLAFEQLQKGNLIFYESDLSECGLDAAATSMCSGVFTQVFREEPGLYQDKVYCFIHLSVQEFLAALHLHLTFFNSGVDLLTESVTPWYMDDSESDSDSERFYRSAVDQALQSPNGHLDLVLRFLLGLSLPTNQRLLSGLLTQTGSSSQTNVKTAEFIKQKLNVDELSAERRMNLLHCLNELNDHSLVEQVQQSLREGRLSDKHMSVSEWAAVAFLVLSSDSDLEEFDLRKYQCSDDALQGLQPLVKAASRVTLSGCNLSYQRLDSVLNSSALTHLDLSHCYRMDYYNMDKYIHNMDNYVMGLCVKLESAPCRLQTLSLSGCGLSHLCCGRLASVLSSSALTHLDLSNNDLWDSGVELLCEGLQSAPCRLEVLRLSGCLVTERGGASLASALSSAHSRLRELDLSYNHPGPSAELLTAVRDDPLCPLDTLRLDPAGQRWMVPGPRKNFCEVALDPNTANNPLEVSEDKRSVTNRDHQDGSYSQVLSSTALTGRCYWDVELSGDVDVAVSYRGVRGGGGEECRFGDSDQSWSLRVSKNLCFLYHCKRKIKQYSSSSNRAGVFLDTEAGVLTFYKVFSDGRLRPVHTFSSSLSEPLFAGFGLCPGSSVSLLDQTL